jgi:transcriptional regulator with GAF, ATPase, and Fis domain
MNDILRAMPPPEPPEETTIQLQLVPALKLRTRPRLTWTYAQGSHEVILDQRKVVGSAPHADLVISDPAVSRLHAELDPRADGLWVRDPGSRNGTFVEGLLAHDVRVPPGGKIRIGSTDILVEYDTGEGQRVKVWPTNQFGRLVGASLAMRELFATLSRIAPMEAPVLIHGETGTGKELVAHAIHQASRRSKRPFVVVDCAALPENLLDAELFGHAKGAFTGAATAREGAIEAADGGTVFLDEIGELPLSMQPKLLRVLETHTVRRVGETGYRDVDFRFISATHRDLVEMVNAGEFREDLYFRLTVLPVSVPPLRDRIDDIDLLVNHFLGPTARGTWGPEVIRELGGRPWRGNVRELRNFVERARALGAPDALALMHEAAFTRDERPTGVGPESLKMKVARPPFPPEVVAAAQPPAYEGNEIFEREYREFRERWVDYGEREYVRRLLQRHGHNVAAAARDAKLDRTYLHRLVRKHDL